MTTQSIIIFIVFNVLNVIIQTIKSIATIKCGKNMAALVNAIAYGLYTYIVVLTADDGFSLWFKIIVVALGNLVGVWVVKYVEEKKKKDKLWKIELAIPIKYPISLVRKEISVPHNYIEVGDYTMYNCYCETQKQTTEMVKLAKKYEGKISAYESQM